MSCQVGEKEPGNTLFVHVLHYPNFSGIGIFSVHFCMQQHHAGADLEIFEGGGMQGKDIAIAQHMQKYLGHTHRKLINAVRTYYVYYGYR